MTTSTLNKISHFIFVLLTATCLVSCKKDNKNLVDDTKGTSVVITSINVNSGSYNTVVEISGKMFSSDAKKDSVYFNGKVAKIVSATETKIVATVPVNSGTGKISVSVNKTTPVMGPVFTYIPTMMVTTYAGLNSDGIYENKGGKFKFHDLTALTIDVLGSIYTTEIRFDQLNKIDAAGIASIVLDYNYFYEVGNFSPSFLSYPYKITSDAKGNLYVVDYFFLNSRIFKISPDGKIKSIALKPNLYGPSILKMDYIIDIAVDPDGNIFITTTFKDIRKIGTDGVLSIMAGGAHEYKDGIGTSAGFESPDALTIDPSGNLYVADKHRIRKITKEGVVTTFAGNETSGLKNGVGTQAMFGIPTAIVADTQGNIYVADPDNFVVRKITPEKVVTTFAGSGKPGTKDGLSQNASFSLISGITVDAAGIVYVSEGYPGIIRKIGLQ